MKKFKLLSALLACSFTQHTYGFDLGKWAQFTLKSKKPWSENEKHAINITEGPAKPTSDPTRIFCAEITQEHPHGRVTQDDSIAENAEPKKRLKTPLCDPATCLTQCGCKATMQSPPAKEFLFDALRNMSKKRLNPITTCQGLCFFDENCTCSTARGRYNKSHPHIRLGSTSTDINGEVTTDISVNMQACTLDKDFTSPWIYILCDQNTKLYQLFRIKQIKASGKDVTQELEKKYRERCFGKK